MMRCARLAVGVAVLAASASACIFKYGTSPDALGPHATGTLWDHGMHGDDWDGVDGSGKTWQCMTGKRQSPINVPSYDLLDVKGRRVMTKQRTHWFYPTLDSNGSNIEVINNGHTIQVEWLSPYAADVKIAVPASITNKTSVTAVLGMKPSDKASYVKAVPAQFHFHATSEHLLDGKYFPLELHIVHRVTDLPACAAGCYTVTGILFKLVDGPDNPLLDSIWAAMPMREGAINYLPAGAKIELGKLLPRTVDREYVTYEGSLTTPPCTEGLLWHVLTHPQTISLNQWRKYMTATGFKDCSATNSSASSAHTHRHHHRRMLAEEQDGNPDDYTCKFAAYGYNFRSAQAINHRTILLAKS